MNSKTKSLRVLAIASTVLFAGGVAMAQTIKADGLHFPLGDRMVTIPAPEGFEEATSQFDSVKERFTATEAPANDMLAAHLPRANCAALRAGEFARPDFYTKVSIRRANRDVNISAEYFAQVVSEYRKSGMQILDPDNPGMKATLANINKGLTELNQKKTEISLSQPINLGEFDTRPNVYSVMVLLNIKAQNTDGETSALVLGGLSYVRVKERLIYVYTYRTYKSESDIPVLRDFAKQWIGQILAAN
jgi:hypothetical protein